MSVNVKYRTNATTSAGKIYTEDGHLSLLLSAPKELGGTGGDGTNPEQLFAAGYSACFFASIRFAGQQRNVKLPADASVTANIGIGPGSDGSWRLVADLVVNLPGIDRREVEELIEAAHQICPYSNSTRNNIEVGFNIV